MLSSQQPPTQISSHAQLLEIFIEVDQRGDIDVDVDVDVSSSLLKAKEESTIQRNTTALSIIVAKGVKISTDQFFPQKN